MKPSNRIGWVEALKGVSTIASLKAAWAAWLGHSEVYSPSRAKYRLNKMNGPMYYLGEVICKRMEAAGYPSKIFCAYRSPEDQNAAYVKGRSKARAYQSPHQFYEAVDIVHQERYWNVSQEYWDTLAVVVRQVEQDFNVNLVHGYDWGWDSAHIETEDWRTVRDLQKRLIKGGQKQRMWVPTPEERLARFDKLLPGLSPRQR